MSQSHSPIGQQKEKESAARHPANDNVSEGVSWAPPPFQLKTSEGIEVEEKNVDSLQMKGDSEGFSSVPPPDAPKNNTGLPDNLKSEIEQLSGYSMDDVKVHRNSDKPAQFKAHAYAQGTDIHLGPGQEKHLPHEAWHVVQQKQGRVKPTMQMKGGVDVNDDFGLEREADVMGNRAIQEIAKENTYSSFEGPAQFKKSVEGKTRLVTQMSVIQFGPPDSSASAEPKQEPKHMYLVAETLVAGSVHSLICFGQPSSVGRGFDQCLSRSMRGFEMRPTPADKGQYDLGEVTPEQEEKATAAFIDRASKRYWPRMDNCHYASWDAMRTAGKRPPSETNSWWFKPWS